MHKNKIDSNLSVSRAVGDFNYKEAVISEGDQYIVDLEKYVVLASDGLVIDRQTIFEILDRFGDEHYQFEEDDVAERFTFNQMSSENDLALSQEELMTAFEYLLKKQTNKALKVI